MWDEERQKYFEERDGELHRLSADDPMQGGWEAEAEVEDEVEAEVEAEVDADSTSTTSSTSSGGDQGHPPPVEVVPVSNH